MRAANVPLRNNLIINRLILIFVISGVVFLGKTVSSDENTWGFLEIGSGKYDKIRIKTVVSADTIILDNDEKIKLIGLKAPEPPKKKKEEIKRNEYGFIIEEPEESPVIPVEEKAYNFAFELMAGKEVRIEFDEQKKNEQFLTLAYVFLFDDHTLVNEEILRQGYAHLQIRPPNLKYENRLREAYQEARRERRGLQGE